MDYRLGLCVFGSQTGLGYQTYNYYKFLKPSAVLGIDISKLNNMPVNRAWYPKSTRWTDGFPSKEDCEWLVDNSDVILVAETPLTYYLFEYAEKKRVKTILVPNFEFNDYFQNPNLPQPSVFALPSLWNVKRMSPKMFPQVINLPVPVDTSILPNRKIKAANTFFHIAGRPAINDRNGTLYFIEACKRAAKIIPKAKYLLYCQDPNQQITEALKDSPVTLMPEVKNYADLYKKGDVLILPRRFGGLCLPCNEALGSGIPVLMPDIDPNNLLLPPEFLFTVGSNVQTFMARTTIQLYTPSVNSIVDKMVYLHNNPSTAKLYASKAAFIGQHLSWEIWKVKYDVFLKELCS